MALNYTVVGTKQNAEEIKSVWKNSFLEHLRIFENSVIINELNKDSICIDAGANVGIISQLFASKGAKVYAFEPNPTAFKELKKNATSNMHCYKQGVWDKNTKMRLYMYKLNKEDPLFWSQGSSILVAWALKGKKIFDSLTDKTIKVNAEFMSKLTCEMNFTPSQELTDSEIQVMLQKYNMDSKHEKFSLVFECKTISDEEVSSASAPEEKASSNFDKYSLLEKIFSVKNSKDKKYKILTMLGIKLKFRKHA